MMQNRNNQKTVQSTNFKNFDDMELQNELLRSIYSVGFDKPSSIQQQAIEPMAKGKSIIVQSPPGTGKTLIFIIGTLQQINSENNNCQVIILVPTPELVFQTQDIIVKFSQYLDIGCFASFCIPSMKNIKQAMKEGFHVIIGTPKSIGDMIDIDFINPETIQILVLDEADELLSNKFREQTLSIHSKLPKSVQIGIFTDIMTQEIYDFSNEFMNDAMKFIEQENDAVGCIKQFYIDCNYDEFKIDTLVDLYQVVSVNQSVVFCNSKNTAQEIESRLTSHNYRVDMIHEDMSIEERYNIIMKFRQGSLRILVATDIVDRGIQLNQVSLVVNYDLPFSDIDYFRRAGKAARFGRKGITLDMITTNEMKRIKQLEKMFNCKIEPLPKNFMNYL